jgi:hypothetical protein
MTAIWLSDLAAAFHEIKPATDAERREIANLLGLDDPSVSAAWPVAQVAGTELPDARSAGPDGDAGSPREEPPADAPERPDPEADHRRAPAPRNRRRGRIRDRLKSSIARIGAALARSPRRGGTGRRGSSSRPHMVVPASPGRADRGGRTTLPRVDRAALSAVLPMEPLIAPRSARSIAHLLLSRHAPEGPVDSEAAVGMLARQVVIREVPRRRRRTIRLGAQILVDRGDTMRLFARDVSWFVRLAGRLLGGQRLEVLYFVGSPLQGVARRPAGRRQPYRPPPVGTQILLLSDFGVPRFVDHPRRADRAEWETFLRSVSHGSTTPVGLIPTSPRAWPGWLTRRLRLVPWDRSTTAGATHTRLR